MPIQWETLEYTHHEKSADWYWAFGLIVVALVVSAIVFENYLFAVFVVVAAFAVIVFSIRQPEQIEIVIDERGIRIGKEFYPFNTLKSFWIDHKNQNHEKLLLMSKKVLMPLIVIPLEEVPAHIVHEAVAKWLPETELHEPFTHAIMDYLRF